MITVATTADRHRREIHACGDDMTIEAATEETERAATEALGSVQVTQLTWRAKVGDEVARRGAWQTGFTFEGTNRQGWCGADGSVDDAWVATLLQADARLPKSRWLEAVPLTGSEVLLRPVSATDQDRFVETATDSEAMWWLATIPLPRTPAAFRASVARRAVGPSVGSSLTWTIAEPGSDRYLGSLSIFDLDGLDYRSAELGYRLHADARGCGLMSAALDLLVAHAFRAEAEAGLGLERLSLGAADGNLPSVGVARSCGFRETGRDRRCYDLPDGSVVDLVRFDLLASEVPAR